MALWRPRLAGGMPNMSTLASLKIILFVCNKRHEEECFCLYGYFWALSYFLNWLRFYQDSLFGGQEKDGWNEDWAMRRMVGQI